MTVYSHHGMHLLPAQKRIHALIMQNCAEETDLATFVAHESKRTGLPKVIKAIITTLSLGDANGNYFLRHVPTSSRMLLFNLLVNLPSQEDRVGERYKK